MPKVTAIKVEVIPTGEYPVQVTNIEDAVNQFNPTAPQIQWTFEIVGKGQYAGKSMKAWTSLHPGMKSRFMQWANILLGESIGVGDEVDTDDLIGTKALATVLVKRKEDGSEFSKLVDLRPAPKKSTAAPVTASATKTTTPSVPEKDADDGDDPFAFD